MNLCRSLRMHRCWQRGVRPIDTRYNFYPPKIATVSGAFHVFMTTSPRPGVVALLLAALPALAEPSKSDADVHKWLDEHIAAVQPTAAEKHFDEIGWSTQILAAEALAKQHSRPVFLFTHKGHIAVGRC